MQINSYLTFNGQCEEAFRFYEKTLGGRIVAMSSFGETPVCAEIPEDYQSRIMHARLVVGDQVLMASDALPMYPYEGIKGCSVSLNLESPEEAERMFSALAVGGTVQMPIQETFWSMKFGMLTDQYGVPWMVNCEKAAEAPAPSLT